MQDIKQTIAKKVLLKLAKHLKVKGIKGVASYIGEDENKVYAWSKRGKIADTGAILGKCPEIRKEWLETGEGEMFKGNDEREPFKLTSEAKANIVKALDMCGEVPAPKRLNDREVELAVELERYFFALSEEGKERIVHMAKGFLLKELQD